MSTRTHCAMALLLASGVLAMGAPGAEETARWRVEGRLHKVDGPLATTLGMAAGTRFTLVVGEQGPAVGSLLVESLRLGAEQPLGAGARLAVEIGETSTAGHWDRALLRLRVLVDGGAQGLSGSEASHEVSIALDSRSFEQPASPATIVSIGSEGRSLAFGAETFFHLLLRHPGIGREQSLLSGEVTSLTPVSPTSAAGATAVPTLDLLQTDGDKYRLVLENDCVRVLEYRDRPGEQTGWHAHPAFVLYALSDFSRTITLPDGRRMQRRFRSGDAVWADAQTHVGTNTGETPSHALLVEMKSGIAACASR